MKPESNKPTDTRVEVLEVEVHGIKKTLGVALEKLDAIASTLAGQPRHTPLVDIFKIIGATVTIMTGVFVGAGWWMNVNLSPIRDNVKNVVVETADIAVMRYRLDLLEKGVRISEARNSNNP